MGKVEEPEPRAASRGRRQARPNLWKHSKKGFRLYKQMRDIPLQHLPDEQFKYIVRTLLETSSDTTLHLLAIVVVRVVNR